MPRVPLGVTVGTEDVEEAADVVDVTELEVDERSDEVVYSTDEVVGRAEEVVSEPELVAA
jgi:hypothetical protein